MRAIVFAVALLLVGCSAGSSKISPNASLSAASSSNASARPCPVTSPNGLTPPGEPPDELNFGNGRLWTVLWPGGLVLVPPDDIRPDGSLGMKFPWWRGPSIRGHLHIRGHELTLGVPVRADARGYGDTGFNASAIVFPVEGCYRIRGAADGAVLSFVTMVRSCSALAELPTSQRRAYAICDS